MFEPSVIPQRQAVTHPARHPPLPAVKRETAKLVRDVLDQTPKAVVTKLRDRCGWGACAAPVNQADCRQAACFLLSSSPHALPLQASSAPASHGVLAD